MSFLAAAGFTIESGDATLTATGRLQQGDVQLQPEVETIADPA